MRILVSPLDWGLGHATRCIPLIRALRAAGHEVILAAGGGGLRLLRGEFPELPAEELPSRAMRYARLRFLQPIWLLAQLPMFALSVLGDRLRIRGLIARHRIDRVVSDGRYGLWTRRVPCVFVTHQLNVPAPGPPGLARIFSGPLRVLNRLALRGFREVWIPDFPGAPNLSGRLGHPGAPWPKARYVRPLCRFRPESQSWDQPFVIPEAEARIDLMASISGPEPQRTLFETALMKAMRGMAGTRVLVRGLPSPAGARHPSTGSGTAVSPPVRPGELNVFDHLSGETLAGFFSAADRVACRTGYTTVMELAGLGKRNVLMVPTPGQPEQEYLGEHLQALGLAATQAQEDLDLESGFRRASDLPGFARLYSVPHEGSTGWTLAGWLREHPLFQAPEVLAGKTVF